MNYREAVYRSMYDSEEQWRETLHGRVNVPIAICTIFGGILSYYIRKIPKIELTSNGDVDWILTAFVGILILLFACLCITVCFLIRATVGYRYARIADSKRFSKYEDEIKHWRIGLGDDEKAAIEYTEKEFRDYLIGQYQGAANFNRVSNIQRTSYLVRANYFVLLGLILVGISLPFWFLISQQTEDVITVKLNNAVEVMMSNTDKPEDTSKPPEKPKGPDLTIIKESEDRPTERRDEGK